MSWIHCCSHSIDHSRQCCYDCEQLVLEHTAMELLRLFQGAVGLAVPLLVVTTESTLLLYSHCQSAVQLVMALAYQLSMAVKVLGVWCTREASKLHDGIGYRCLSHASITFRTSSTARLKLKVICRTTQHSKDIRAYFITVE